MNLTNSSKTVQTSSKQTNSCSRVTMYVKIKYHSKGNSLCVCVCVCVCPLCYSLVVGSEVDYHCVCTLYCRSSAPDRLRTDKTRQSVISDVPAQHQYNFSNVTDERKWVQVSQSASQGASLCLWGGCHLL